jgi:hypothetical protein
MLTEKDDKQKKEMFIQVFSAIKKQLIEFIRASHHESAKQEEN